MRRSRDWEKMRELERLKGECIWSSLLDCPFAKNIFETPSVYTELNIREAVRSLRDKLKREYCQTCPTHSKMIYYTFCIVFNRTQ